LNLVENNGLNCGVKYPNNDGALWCLWLEVMNNPLFVKLFYIEIFDEYKMPVMNSLRVF